MQDSETLYALKTELVADKIAVALENHKWMEAARDAENFHKEIALQAAQGKITDQQASSIMIDLSKDIYSVEQQNDLSGREGVTIAPLYKYDDKIGNVSTGKIQIFMEAGHGFSSQGYCNASDLHEALLDAGKNFDLHTASRK